MDLINLSAAELSQKLETGQVSSVEITRAYLDRIEAVDGKIQAFLHVSDELALDMADQADQTRARGEAGPLTGVPIGVKDVIITQGLPTTAGSKILEGFVPPFDAALAAKIRQAGLPILGKLNMDEFAMGSTTEWSAYQVTKNPWKTTHIPGGSSGGSAAALASNMAPLAIGTDTGGSIRQPASHCGVVGIKPTYGRVSRFGLIAFGSSLDQAGPMARTVADAAQLLNLIAGYDPKDSTSVDRPVPDFSAACGRSVKGLKVGLPKEYFGAGLDPEVGRIIDRAVKALEGLGAETVEVSLPLTEYGVMVYYIIAPAEASSNLARFDGVKYGLRVSGEDLGEMYTATRSAGFGPEVIRRIMLGTYVLSAGYYDAYYRKASQVRTLLIRDYDQVFDQVDVLISPTAPTAAPALKAMTDDPLQMYLSDVLTLPTNLAGLPGMVVPAGLTEEGLPVGVQMTAARFEEETLFRTAFALEQELDFNGRHPRPQV